MLGLAGDKTRGASADCADPMRNQLARPPTSQPASPQRRSFTPSGAAIRCGSKIASSVSSPNTTGTGVGGHRDGEATGTATLARWAAIVMGVLALVGPGGVLGLLLGLVWILVVGILTFRKEPVAAGAS